MLMINNYMVTRCNSLLFTALFFKEKSSKNFLSVNTIVFLREDIKHVPHCKRL